MSVSDWIESTNAIGLIAIDEFQRLKAAEQAQLGWSVKRELSNMESLNSVLINEGLPQSERLVKLNQIAISQMTVLENAGQSRLLEKNVK